MAQVEFTLKQGSRSTLRSGHEALHARAGQKAAMTDGFGSDRPTKVTRVALENAASIASMLLTTECVISEEREEKAAGHSHGPDMGGMGGIGSIGGMM